MRSGGASLLHVDQAAYPGLAHLHRGGAGRGQRQAIRHDCQRPGAGVRHDSQPPQELHQQEQRSLSRRVSLQRR